MVLVKAVQLVVQYLDKLGSEPVLMTAADPLRDDNQKTTASKLDADFGSDCVGDGLGVVAHEGLGFGFDHHAG
jgi:hypothetical protein